MMKDKGPSAAMLDSADGSASPIKLFCALVESLARAFVSDDVVLILVTFLSIYIQR